MTGKPGAAIEGALHSIDGKGVVRMKARCDADIDDLWLVLTTPERLARWTGKVEATSAPGAGSRTWPLAVNRRAAAESSCVIRRGGCA
jgi:hypothetical protein